MLHLHPPHQLPHSNRISHVHAMPPRGIPHPQFGRSRILFRVPLERKNRIVVTQKRLTARNQLVEPLWRGPHLAAVVLLEADRTRAVSDSGLMVSVRVVQKSLTQWGEFRLCHAQLHCPLATQQHERAKGAPVNKPREPPYPPPHPQTASKSSDAPSRSRTAWPLPVPAAGARRRRG